jgi:hypothetical protein
LGKSSYDHSDFALDHDSSYLQRAAQGIGRGDTMAGPDEQAQTGELQKISWWDRAEAVADSLAGPVVVALRGCLHGHLSWPVALRGYAYRVCLSCGAKRLFDENTFTAYGPFCYDFNELIAPEKSTETESHPEKDLQHPTP